MEASFTHKSKDYDDHHHWGGENTAMLQKKLPTKNPIPWYSLMTQFTAIEDELCVCNEQKILEENVNKLPIIGESNNWISSL